MPNAFDFALDRVFRARHQRDDPSYRCDHPDDGEYENDKEEPSSGLRQMYHRLFHTGTA